MRRLVALALLVLMSAPALASVRLKDITFPRGAREYQLLGYGLVVGLQGTGDTLRNAPFTEQSVSSMLDRLGVNVRNSALRTRNLAAVMVTAALPPFVGWGSTIDVTVSAMGDATSLMGGTLLLTSLTGIDGNVYAIAQGPIAVSGFAVGGQNETLTHGVATVGRVPNGATIEREAPRPSSEDGALMLELRNPDFATAVRIVDAINHYSQAKYHQRIARERDNRTISLTATRGGATRLLAEIGELRIEPSTPARVVIDERTGTVVIGQDVKISPVALTHGGLTVRINETPEVSQPAPFSNGRTTVTSQTRITATEEVGGVATLEGPTLRTLVRGLNQIGLKPTGIISILQAIKTAGALQADLVIQ
ncbi:flagellar P-ring protein 2 [Methylosinus sp. C49]|uniref:flagellar basal body P-ring protein FlgI n=1 Tax=Methylosinus sp. C49 TaxID=2699395 RepID=UPI001366DC1F|nr:flagellar basal body P-ring protein FlgI [Methylosinus sp. C49]BBU61655.1 flagellar P-ring protein 2 [Methylosinus sp. C49]